MPFNAVQVRDWRRLNAKTVAAYKKVYYAAHKEETHRRTSEWRKRNPEYITWLSMLWRCKNPKGRDYKTYGSRGIEVKYQNFYEFLSDVGDRPSKGYSVDRINNNGHYEVGNCRWATATQQRANRRDSIRGTL